MNKFFFLSTFYHPKQKTSCQTFLSVMNAVKFKALKGCSSRMEWCLISHLLPSFPKQRWWIWL